MTVTVLPLKNAPAQPVERLHYVYELRDEDGRVFYVGKGVGSRAFSHITSAATDKNQAKASIILRAMRENRPISVHIVEWFESNEEALIAENARIKRSRGLANGRRGRPEGATLTEEIRIRMEPELLATVDQSAGLAGVTRSALIRHAVGVYLSDAGIEPRAPGRRARGEGV